MGLLDRLEKELIKHPLTDKCFDVKINYLKSIAYFIAIDDEINDIEKFEFNELIYLLNCEDIKEDLDDFLKKPELDEFENIFEFLNDNALSIDYLLEIFFLVSDKKLKDLEIGLLKIVANIFDYSELEIQDIFIFVTSIKEVSNTKEAFTKILQNERLFKYKDKYGNYNYDNNKYSNFYKINTAIKKQLNQMIEDYKSEHYILNHPLKDSREKIRWLYLMSLAYTISQESSILTYKQKNIFFKIVEILGFFSKVDELENVLKNPDFYLEEEVFEPSIDQMIEDDFMVLITADIGTLMIEDLDNTFTLSRCNTFWISGLYIKKSKIKSIELKRKLDLL